jgi:hypothetical protein
MAPGKHRGEARNSLAGRTTFAEAGLRCVTTRPRMEPYPGNQNSHQRAAGFGLDLASVGDAPPGRAADAPPAPPDAAVAASSPANDTPSADTRGLGSTADSPGGPDTSAHIPCAGKSAIPAAAPWRRCPLRCSPGNVPWEVATPLGPPGEDTLRSPRALVPWCLVPSPTAAWRPPYRLPLPSLRTGRRA